MRAPLDAGAAMIGPGGHSGRPLGREAAGRRSARDLATRGGVIDTPVPPPRWF